ncbi:DnaJ-domain-containing protein [Meredithblackwellia eburnea MCA 4105]
MITVQTRLKQPYIALPCVHCKTEVEYLAPATATAQGEPFEVKCVACNQTWIIRPPKPKQTGKRRIGTDEKPLDMAYYDLLGLPANCTTEDVKKAYRRLAIKHHPDKNLDDPNAAEKFKEIAIAYNTLSDEGLRHSYNEFGKGKADGGGEDNMVDPEALFSQLFGGQAFDDIIGTISLGSEMKSAMQDEEDPEEEEPATQQMVTNKDGKQVKAPLSPEEIERRAKKKAAKDAHEKKVAEEKAKVREARVVKLIERLRNQLALFTEQALGEEDEQTAAGVRAMWTIKAEELKQESYGTELLQTVGFVYSAKSKHYLASTGPIPFGLGGWFHSARSTAHIVTETVSTVRSAYALKEVFEKLSAAEKSGLSEEKKKELEDKAAQMGLHALFKGAKLEVQSVIREVCDRLLAEDVPIPELRKRAVAMGILGSVYEAVKKDESDPANPPLSPPPFR